MKFHAAMVTGVLFVSCLAAPLGAQERPCFALGVHDAVQHDGACGQDRGAGGHHDDEFHKRSGAAAVEHHGAASGLG